MDKSEILAFVKAESRDTPALRRLSHKSPDLAALLSGKLPPHAHEPAKRLEDFTGLRGISQNYNFFPQSGAGRDQFEIVGLKFELTEHHLTPEGHRPLLRMADVLQAENPALQHIQFSRTEPEQALQFVMGTVAGLHPEDIDFYINKHAEMRTSAYRDLGEGVRKHLIERFGKQATIDWNPSFTVLRKIDAQLDRLPRAAVVAEKLAQAISHVHL